MTARAQVLSPGVYGDVVAAADAWRFLKPHVEASRAAGVPIPELICAIEELGGLAALKPAVAEYLRSRDVEFRVGIPTRERSAPIEPAAPILSDVTPGRWIDAKSAAEMLGCSVRNVTERCQRQTLRGVKRGLQWQVDRTHIDELLADRRARRSKGARRAAG